jgi:hypothetical protein
MFGITIVLPVIAPHDRCDLKDHGMVTGYFATTN